MRSKRPLPVTSLLAVIILVQGAALMAAAPTYTPGAPGVGDEYYPLYGNGGYQVRHYDLTVRYDPQTDYLSGVARIDATATQGLSRFNLDLVGLTVRRIDVDGESATWSRTEHELEVTPASPIGDGSRFRVIVRYDGVPVAFTDRCLVSRWGSCPPPTVSSLPASPKLRPSGSR